MKTRRLIFPLVLIALSSCATEPTSQFLIPKETLVVRVQRIAMLSHELPSAGSIPKIIDPGTASLSGVIEPASADFYERFRNDYEGLIADHLRRLGYEVILAKDVRPVMEKLLKQHQASIDPSTGKVIGFFDPSSKRDEKRLRLYMQQLRAEIKSKFGADSLLLPAIIVSTARAGDGFEWDGTKQDPQRSYWKMTKDLFTTLGFAGLGLPMQLPALSLVAQIQDINGETLWWGKGGIHLLAMFEGLKEVVQLSVATALGDGDRNRKAIEIAFSGLQKQR